MGSQLVYSKFFEIIIVNNVFILKKRIIRIKWIIFKIGSFEGTLKKLCFKVSTVFYHVMEDRFLSITL
jgi:hypothetical protein